MAEVSKYLGIEFPDGSVKIEGPMTVFAAKKRTVYFVDREGLPVTSTEAVNEGEAIIKIITFVLNRQKVNK